MDFSQKLRRATGAGRGVYVMLLCFQHKTAEGAPLGRQQKGQLRESSPSVETSEQWNLTAQNFSEHLQCLKNQPYTLPDSEPKEWVRDFS
ncbi:Hypothetical predicted protein [Podarcis lilfordi]|uniref:Uncharacterized protein n=1 Tax=Podarcis lilfordi TaxID=74358 RepID=A0AA35KW37_9SAUR|nr:Hypothetical predicted protein [Podarcis lilfordi]